MAAVATIWLCDASGDDGAVEDTRVLNDGLFVGRLLGVDVGAAIAVLDAVGGGRRLSSVERRTLAAAYGEARLRLAVALDGDGRAIPGAADPLLASSVVAADERGVLYLKGARVDLINLARTLEALGRLFRAAEERALDVEIKYG